MRKLIVATALILVSACTSTAEKQREIEQEIADEEFARAHPCEYLERHAPNVFQESFARAWWQRQYRRCEMEMELKRKEV